MIEVSAVPTADRQARDHDRPSEIDPVLVDVANGTMRQRPDAT